MARYPAGYEDLLAKFHAYVGELIGIAQDSRLGIHSQRLEACELAVQRCMNEVEKAREEQAAKNIRKPR